MEQIERGALNILHDKLKHEIETSWIARYLLNYGVISDEQRIYYEGDDDPVHRAENLLLFLPENCTIDILFEVLERVDQEYIIQWIKNAMDHLSRHPERLYRNRPNYNSRAFKRYSIAANDLQVKVFNVDTTMKRLGPMITFLKGMKGNDRLHWDNIFAIVDAGLGKKRTQQKLRPIGRNTFLQHMEDVISNTSFPLPALMILESRQAEALALNGQTKDALVLAMKSTENIDYDQPSRHNGKLLYSLINIQVQYYSENSDRNVKNMVLTSIRNGYSQFNFEDYDTQRLWKRMYLVKEAFLHLGIDTESRDIIREIITHHDMCEARRCLDKVKYEFWDGIDKRREMLYYRAEAKYAILQGQEHAARTMLNKGLDIAGEEFSKEAATFREILHNVSCDFSVFRSVHPTTPDKLSVEETNRDHDNNK